MQSAKKARIDVKTTSAADVDQFDKTLDNVFDVQDKLDKLADEMSEKGLQLILQLNEEYSKLKAPYYEARMKLVHEIPQFWKIVFCQHPVLATLLTADDEEILNHITEMDIKEFEDQRGGFTLEFSFSSNPYFTNEKLQKIVRYDDAGCMVLDGTGPCWREGMEPVDVHEEVISGGKRKQERVYNFFMWFVESGTMDAGQQDELSLLLRDELWPNPLKHYRTSDKDKATESPACLEVQRDEPNQKTKSPNDLENTKSGPEGTAEKS